MRSLAPLLLFVCSFLPMSEARAPQFGPYYHNVNHAKKQKKYKTGATHKVRGKQFKRFKK
jgi:hypothetical protein